MRKAFDANVPKLKPRLRGAVQTTPEAPPPAEAPASPAALGGEGRGAGQGRAPVQAELPSTLPAVVVDERTEREFARGPAAPAEPVAHDVQSRRERLAKIKRRVAEAARPTPRAAPAPADPARAAESVLGLVKDLERELFTAREREDALRADLEAARTDLTRFAGEGRTAAERLAAAETELAEKRQVLGEMLGEMGALEEERDEAVRRAQALSALDEERARLLDDVTRRADEEARVRAEREAEVEKLSEELRAGATDAARLRAAIGELARERDQLASDLDRARRERDELAAAKGALE
jgi:chromosome segregation ATPase